MTPDVSLARGIKVLYVDQDPDSIAVLRFALRDDARVVTYVSALRGLEELKDDPEISVAVCALRLLGMNGLEFLRVASEANPDVAGILLTDLSDSSDPVIRARHNNLFWRVYPRGEFLDDPTNTVRIVREASLESARRRVKSLRKRHAGEIEKRLFQEGAKDPQFPTGLRPQALVVAHILPHLDISDRDKSVLLLAADCYDLGRRVAPDDPEREREIAGRVLVGLEGLEKVYEAARDWRERFDGSGPQGKRGEDIPLFARVIAVVSTFASFIAGNEDVRPMRLDDALGLIRDDSGKLFDPEVVQVLCQMISKVKEETECGRRGDADTAALFLSSSAERAGAN